MWSASTMPAGLGKAARAALVERWPQRGTNRGCRGTVAAVALPDTRQRLRRGAELLGGAWDK